MKKDLVVKSNKLVNQSYKLSANEQKILYLLITKINKEDEDFKLYALKIADFITLSGLEGKDKFDVNKGLPKITRGLLKKGFSVIDEKGNLLQVNWLSSAYHRRHEGIIELEFSPRLKPYLLQLKEKFTMFRLDNVIRLKSIYSMRIYELLKQFESYGERTISLDDLKLMLCIHDLKAYNLYGNIKLKILDVAKNELKEQCDIFFEYTEIKEGKKVIKVKFIIYKQYQQVRIEKETTKVCFGNSKTKKPKKIENQITFDSLDYNKNSNNKSYINPKIHNFDEREYPEDFYDQFIENLK